jgi:hypothetical protein
MHAGFSVMAGKVVNGAKIGASCPNFGLSSHLYLSNLAQVFKKKIRTSRRFWVKDAPSADTNFEKAL